MIVDWVASLVEGGETYLVLLPAYVGILATERIAHVFFSERPWDTADSVANLLITGAFLLVEVVIGALLPVGLMALLYTVRWFTIDTTALGWALCFLLHDFVWYWDHRLGHRVGLFWAMHHVHHSSPNYNTTVSSRGFLGDATYLPRPTFYLLPLLGVSPTQFLTVSIFVSIWGIAQHTALIGRLGWLDWWLATPSSHRVHHGSNPEYLDKNYGEVLMVWDHLFGTYAPEVQPPEFGVTEPIETTHVGRIQLAGFAWLRRKLGRAQTVSDRLRCLVMPPEWEPPQRVPQQS